MTYGCGQNTKSSLGRCEWVGGGCGGFIFLTPGRQHFLKVFLDISQGGLNEVVMVSCLGPAVIEKGQLLIKTTQRHHDTFVCFVALF